MTAAYGCDVSHYQSAISWAQVAAAGKRFAILKASEGTALVDDRFAANVLGAKNAGLKVSAYHFFRPGLDPVAQARFFYDRARSLGDGDLIPWLDVEADRPSVSGAVVPNATIVAQLMACIVECETLFGVTPGIYTAGWFWNRLGAGTKFSHCPLWVARYPTAGVVLPLPLGWTRYAVHQYTSAGRVAGIAGNVDLDWTPDLEAITVGADRAKIHMAIDALHGARAGLDEAEKLLQEMVG